MEQTLFFFFLSSTPSISFEMKLCVPVRKHPPPAGGQSWCPTKRFVSISIEIYTPPYLMRGSWTRPGRFLRNHLRIGAFPFFPLLLSPFSFSSHSFIVRRHRKTGNIYMNRFIDSSGICNSFNSFSEAMPLSVSLFSCLLFISLVFLSGREDVVLIDELWTNMEWKEFYRDNMSVDV